MVDAYKRYLNLPHWKAFRLEAIEAKNGKCTMCHTKDNLVVHHKHYETLGKETLDDVEVLCRKCHRLIAGDNGSLSVDYRLIRSLPASCLRVYMILKMDALLNNDGAFSALTQQQISSIMQLATIQTARKMLHKLVDVYNVINIISSGRKCDGYKYEFTHPDDWKLQLD